MEDRIKNNARNKLRYEVRMGRIIKPCICSQCGEKEQFASDSRSMLEAHHHDYLKPTEVKWLCRTCHRRQEHPNTKEHWDLSHNERCKKRYEENKRHYSELARLYYLKNKETMKTKAREHYHRKKASSSSPSYLDA